MGMSFIVHPLLHRATVSVGYFLFVGSKESSAPCWPIIQCPPSPWDGGLCVPLYQRSWPSVLQVVLADPLGQKLCQDVVKIVGVGVAVAGQVGAKFCLVVNLVPHHCVRLARGAGRANGEDEAPVPGHDQQLQDLESHMTEEANLGKSLSTRRKEQTTCRTSGYEAHLVRNYFNNLQ